MKKNLFSAILISLTFSLFATGFNLPKEEDLIIESLPQNLPTNLSITFVYLGEELTLELEKSFVFGINTKFLIDDGSGTLIEVDKGLERSYLGRVTGHPDFIVSAVITDEGLIASINKAGREILEIRPSGKDKRSHKIYTVLKDDHDANHCDIQSKNHIEKYTKVSSTEVSNFSNVTPNKTGITTKTSNKKKSNNTTNKANRRPTKVMTVLEYEVGVEIGSRAFFASTSYNGNLAKAQASAQSLAGNLNARFLRGAGIKHKLGTVIIRTNANTDPLRNTVLSTGTASTAGASLTAFRNYWNNNPNIVGNTHDLAIYHVLSAPSGLAYVNNVATDFKYGTVGGNGPTSWADGTAVHEIGHLWNLKHTNSSGIFYESKPRNNAGSNTSGGSDVFVSVMHGGGSHNIGRLATNEAKTVLAARDAKRSAGKLIRNPGPIPPFGVYDDVTISSSAPSALFDVIANDYDSNNDVLDVRLLDKVSQKGGKISLSIGTGPGGRNQLKYTPPTSGALGTDFFHYTVFDTSGRTDFGAVYVKIKPSTKIKVNLNATAYNYDLGTPTSPVHNGWTRISEETNGDISWSKKVESRDRGTATGVNAINRDLIQSTNKTVLRHKIKNGVWSIIINMGDANYRHDNMRVKAEGKIIEATVTSQANVFTYVEAKNVEVRDGKLNIEVSDNGGSDRNWVWTRLSLKRVGNLPNNRSNNRTSRIAENNSTETQIKLYPNPVKDVLNLSLSENTIKRTSIVIYNSLGKQLITKEISREKDTVDVSRLSSGMYYLRVISDGKTIKNTPFIKQ